jgi:hypothetical protein
LDGGQRQAVDAGGDVAVNFVAGMMPVLGFTISRR